MKIIAPKNTVAAIERYFRFVVPNDSFDDLVIVVAELTEDFGDRYSFLKGIDVAMQYISDPKLMVVITSFLTEEMVATRKPDFFGLLSYANVGFARFPEMADVVRVYRELKSGTKKENVLGKKLFEIETLDRAVSHLRHNLSYAERGAESMRQWLEQARAVGIAGSDEEVVTAVRSWERTTAGKCEGQFFEGVFVDFQGTLMKDGVLQTEVVEKVRQRAAGRSVTVITDSELFQVRRDLAGLNFPVTSKFDLKGAELELVIDDLSEEEFCTTYGIIPRQFVRVDEL